MALLPKITYKSQPKASAGEPQFSFCGSAVGLILIFASIGVIAILGDNITGAQNVDFSDPDSLFQFIDKGSAEINKYNDQVPSFLKSLFGNERIIGTIYLSSGDALIVGAVTKDGKVIQFQRGEIDNPTLKVYTDESVIRKLMSSKDLLWPRRRHWTIGRSVTRQSHSQERSSTARRHLSRVSFPGSVGNHDQYIGGNMGIGSRRP